MSEPGSVTVWIDGLRRREPAAVQAVWERFFDRMVRRARDRLRGANRRAAAAGRFPKLDDATTCGRCC